MAENEGEQGQVNEPEEIAAEDAVGAQETPTERQLEREQAIVEEPVAESEQRIAEATAPAADEKEEQVEAAAPEPAGSLCRCFTGVNLSPSSPSTSICTVSPRAILPRSRCSDNWSSIRLVITRRSGRAPYMRS